MEDNIKMCVKLSLVKSDYQTAYDTWIRPTKQKQFTDRVNNVLGSLPRHTSLHATICEAVFYSMILSGEV